MAPKSTSTRYKITSALGLAKAQVLLDQSTKAGLQLDAVSSHESRAKLRS
jgi:hypothetical protein